MARKFKDDIFVGAVFKNKKDEYATVVRIDGYLKVWIKWEDEYEHEMFTTANQLRTGSFKNPFSPEVRGVGFLGHGEYTPSLNGKRADVYRAWMNMFVRCYDSKYHKLFPTYSNKTVNPIWHNFQNFARWYYTELEGLENDIVWEVDKDLFRSNEYGPESCVLLPERLNVLLVKNDARRGDTLIGVSFGRDRLKYRARCHNGSMKPVHVGWYHDEQSAFLAYKLFKENLIKELAEEYKSRISLRAYHALLNYCVKESD